MPIFFIFQVLPTFQYDPPLPNDLNHYITTLLTSQLQLAKDVCSSTQFSVILKQRLLLLKRIYYALLMKYHDKEKPDSGTCEPSTSTAVVVPIVPREVKTKLCYNFNVTYFIFIR